MLTNLTYPLPVSNMTPFISHDSEELSYILRQVSLLRILAAFKMLDLIFDTDPVSKNMVNPNYFVLNYLR